MEFTRVEIVGGPEHVRARLVELRPFHVIIPYATQRGNLLPEGSVPYDAELDSVSGDRTAIVLCSSTEPRTYDELKHYATGVLRQRLRGYIRSPGVILLLSGHRRGAYYRLPMGCPPEALHNAIIDIAETLAEAANPTEAETRLTERLAQTSDGKDMGLSEFVEVSAHSLSLPATRASAIKTLDRFLHRETESRGRLYAILGTLAGLVLALLAVLFSR